MREHRNLQADLHETRVTCGLSHPRGAARVHSAANNNCFRSGRCSLVRSATNAAHWCTDGYSMRKLARMLWLRHKIKATRSQVWEIINFTALPGREHWQDRDPGKQGKPRNPRRSTGWRYGYRLAMMDRGQSTRRSARRRVVSADE